MYSSENMCCGHHHEYEEGHHEEGCCGRGGWHHHHHPGRHWRFGYAPVRGLLHLLVLKLLSEGPLRGTELRKALKDRLDLDVPSSAIYVILSMLEEKGLVVSSWETEEKGPARKVYRISEEGLDYLKEMVEEIKRYRRVLEYLTS
jgi:PadR family transcriptional regulator PadR